MAERDLLAFQTLSDHDNRVARAYEIAVETDPAMLLPMYQAAWPRPADATERHRQLDGAAAGHLRNRAGWPGRAGACRFRAIRSRRLEARGRGQGPAIAAWCRLS